MTPHRERQKHIEGPNYQDATYANGGWEDESARRVLLHLTIDLFRV